MFSSSHVSRYLPPVNVQKKLYRIYFPSPHPRTLYHSRTTCSPLNKKSTIFTPHTHLKKNNLPYQPHLLTSKKNLYPTLPSCGPSRTFQKILVSHSPLLRTFKKILVSHSPHLRTFKKKYLYPTLPSCGRPKKTAIYNFFFFISLDGITPWIVHPLPWINS